jgi:uncharacterized membrane protein YedE/YeeE
VITSQIAFVISPHTCVHLEDRPVKMAICVLVGGTVGGGCGLLISTIVLIPFWILLLLGGDPVSSLPPIRWVIDREYLFLVWYMAATIGGVLLGAFVGYRLGARR